MLRIIITPLLLLLHLINFTVMKVKSYKLDIEQIATIATALQVRINENEKWINNHKHLCSDLDLKIMQSITMDAENALKAIGY